MVDFINSYSKSVGKVWKQLDSQGPQTQKNLINNANLNTDEFYFAIGWLARENKVSKQNKKYVLSDTNLTDKIGKDAGMIWKILNMWGEVDINSISRLAKINDNEIFSAVGWLAREDKLNGKKIAKDKFSFWLK